MGELQWVKINLKGYFIGVMTKSDTVIVNWLYNIFLIMHTFINIDRVLIINIKNETNQSLITLIISSIYYHTKTQLTLFLISSIVNKIHII